MPPILFKAIVSIIHIPPFMQLFYMNSIYDKSSLEYVYLVITGLSFLKIYFLFEIMVITSPVNSPKGKLLK